MAQGIRKVKVTTYMKKVGRSFGYAVGDTLEIYNPVITSIARDSKSYMKNVKSNMSSMNRGSVSEATKDFNNNPNFLTNLLDDLKSGDYYNTERDEKAALEAMGLDENSFNFDDEDWGDSSDSNNDGESLKAATNNTSKAIIKSMGGFSKGVSRSIGKASAQSAQYIVESNNRASKAIYDMTSSGFNQVSSILLDIDNKMDGLISLGRPLATHMTNSAVFYTQTTQTLNKMSASLDTIVKRTEYMEDIGNPGGRARSNRGGSKSYTMGGMFDMKSYLDMVQQNFADQTMLLKDIFGDKEDLKRKNRNASLMESLLGMAIDAAIPKFTKEAMKSFNESIDNAIQGFLQKGGKQLRDSKSVVGQLLGAIFFPNDNFKRDINPKNYNKGPVQWDGIARKSLVEVIPTYLAKIYASMGGEEKYYDYNIGRFVSIKNIRKQNEYEERQFSNKAGGDLRRQALANAKSDKAYDELEDFFLNAFRDPNGDFSKLGRGRKNKANSKENREIMKKYGLSRESMGILLQILEEDKNAFGNFQSRIYGQNHAFSDSLSREEQSGYSKRMYTKNNFAGEEDKYKKTQADYLRSIYQMVGNIYGSMGSSANGKQKSGKVDNIFNPDTDSFKFSSKSTARQKSNMDRRDETESGDGYGLTDDELQAIESSNKIRETLQAGHDDGIDNIKGKISVKKHSGRFGVLLDLYETPFMYVTAALNTLNDGFNALIWGDKNKVGLLDKIGSSFDNLVDKIKAKFDEKFGDKIKEKAKEKLGDSIGREWTNIKNNVSNKAKHFASDFGTNINILKEARELSAQEAEQEIPGHARGRRITRSGLAVLSEGELVIPSEYNPYYHGSTNKNSELRKEALIRSRFLGSFAEGNRQPQEGQYMSEADKDGQIRYYQWVRGKKGNLVRRRVKKKEYMESGKTWSDYSNTKDYFKAMGSSAKNVANDIANSGPAGFIASGVDTLGQGLKDFFTKAIFGDKKDQDKEKKQLNVNMKKIMEDAVGNKGALAIGGITGAGVSLLTGAIVGPLAGAAIGAGVGLLAKSEAAQDALFGHYQTDDNGNQILDEKGKAKYEQALLGDLGEVIGRNKTAFKTAGIGAGVGAAAGTLMGSPVLGMIAGAGIGFATKSESAQNFLFGKEITAEDGTKFREGGLISKTLQEKIKKAAPNISAGILAGLVAGPFGVVGNVMLGSALGYATTTNQFHEFLFGDGKDKKGLANTIHDKIIKNLDGIFHNAANQIKGFGKKIGRKIVEIGASFSNKLNKLVEDKDKKHPILSKILGGALNTINIPGKILGGINNKMTKHNLKKGYDVYNKDLGRNETASERIQEMINQKIIKVDDNGNPELDQNGNFIYNTFKGGYAKQGNFNQYLANVSDADEIDQLSSQLKGLQNSKIDYDATTKDIAMSSGRDLIKVLGEGSGKDVNKIMKLIRSGDIDKAKDIINKKYSDKSSSVQEIINSADSKMNEAFSDKLKDNAKLQELKDKGIISRGTDITSLLGALETEKSIRFSEDKLEEKEEKDEKYNLIGMLHHMDTILSDQNNITAFKLKGKYGKDLTIALKEGLGNAAGHKKNAWKLTKNADGTYTTSKGKVIEKDVAEKRLFNGTAYIEGSESEEVQEQDLNSEETEESGGASKLASMVRSIGRKAKDAIISKVDFLGNIHQYTKNNQGELTEVSNDNETKKSKKLIDKFTSSVLSITGITESINKMTGMFGSLKEKLLGSEDGKKEGLLSKLFGENGYLGGLFRFFTNSKIGQTIKTVLSGGIGSVFSGIIAPALLLGGFSGAFDSIGSAIGNLKLFKGNDTQSTLQNNQSTQVTLADGTTAWVKTDENGNPITDANGNYTGTDGSSISKSNVTGYNRVGSNTSVSSQLTKNLVNGAILGKGSVTSTVIKNAGKTWKNAYGKVTEKLGSTAVKAGEEVAEETVQAATKKGAWKLTKNAEGKYITSTGKELAEKTAKSRLKNGTAYLAEDATKELAKDAATNTGLIDGILKSISTSLEKFPDFVKNIPLMPDVVKNNVDEFTVAIYTHIDDALKGIGNAGKKLTQIASKIAKVMPLIQTVYVVGKAINCWGNAESILGITQTATIGQRAIAALIGVANACIPVIGDLIPEKVLVNIFMTVANKIGLDVSDLQEQRDAATKELEAYNEENGTDLSIEEYNQMNGKAGIITKATNKIKSIGSSIKEKGIGGSLKDTATNIKNGAGKAVSTVANGIKKVATKIDDVTGFTTLMKYAADGDIKGYLSYDGKDSDEEDESGIGSIVKKVPLLYTKIAMLPKALVIATGANIFKLVKKIANDGSELFNAMKASEQVGQDAIENNKGFDEYWNFEDSGVSEDNTFHGIASAAIVGSRIASFVPVLFKRIGKSIKNAFGSWIDTLKSDGTGFVDSLSGLEKSTEKFDIKDMLKNFTWTASPLNPLKETMEFAHGTASIGAVAIGAFSAAGKAIKSLINDEAVQKDATRLGESLDSIKKSAKSLDIKSVAKGFSWKASEDNPIGPLFEFAHFVGYIGAVIGGVVNKLSDTFGDVWEAIRDKLGIGSSSEETKSDKKTEVEAGKTSTSIGQWLYNALSGGDSGFVSQYDPRYQGYRVSGQQFGAKGCGPAVAAMAANAMGKNLSVSNAVSNARGYETSNGVTVDYFQRALGSRGINTELIAGGSSADMYSRLASGEKVVLLGRDPYNTSKDNSPFGPNNHYVLANGLDRNGNVIVSDPELNGPRAYSPAILKSASVGVAGGRSGLIPSRLRALFAGGSSVRNDETTQQIWSYLTTKLGMSEAAAAGVMGNMQQESGCMPDTKQKGGSAYGLCQWDGDRKTALLAQKNPSSLATQLAYLGAELPSQYWKSSGTIDDTDGKSYKYSSCTYDQFKQMTDVSQATIKFEAAFERAGNPNIPNRISYAVQYYQMFTGKNYEYSLSDIAIDTSAISSNSNSSSSSSDDSSSSGVTGFLSTISSVFSNVFGSILGTGSSSLSTNNTSSSTSGTDSTGTTEGTSYNVASANFSGKTPIDYMKSIAGKLKYSMDGPRNPDKGSADCSSTVRWAIKKAGGPDIGNSTDAQYNNTNLTDVWYGDGAYASKLPDNIQPNDLLFFSRPTYSYTAGRKDRVGHVELYEGDGKMMGLRSKKEMGPTEKNVPLGSSGKLIKVARVKTSGAGSGLGLVSYDDLCGGASGSKSTLLRSRAGAYNASIRNGARVLGNPHEYYGGASNITDGTANILNTIKSTASNGSVSKETVGKLLESITNLLNSIADNTAPVQQIYNLLSQYYATGGASGLTTSKTTASKKTGTDDRSYGTEFSSQIDSNVQALAGVLAELAKG